MGVPVHSKSFIPLLKRNSSCTSTWLLGSDVPFLNSCIFSVTLWSHHFPVLIVRGRIKHGCQFDTFFPPMLTFRLSFPSKNLCLCCVCLCNTKEYREKPLGQRWSCYNSFCSLYWVLEQGRGSVIIMFCVHNPAALRPFSVISKMKPSDCFPLPAESNEWFTLTCHTAQLHGEHQENWWYGTQLASGK